MVLGTAFTSAPAVLAGVSSFNDTSDVVAARAFSVTSAGFRVALQEEHDADGARTGTEQVHFIALEQGSG